MRSYRDIKQINKQLSITLGIYEEANLHAYGLWKNIIILEEKILRTVLRLGWRFAYDSRIKILLAKNLTCPYYLLFRDGLQAVLEIDNGIGYSGFSYFFEPDSFLLTHLNQRHKLWTSERNIKDILVPGAHLSYFKISDNKYNDCDISNSDLQYSSFKNMDLLSSNFYNSNARKAKFKNTNLCNSDFSYSDLRGAKFTNCDFLNTNFLKANIDKASFTRCKDLWGAIFHETILDIHKMENNESVESAGIFINAKFQHVGTDNYEYWKKLLLNIS